jgi:hypothetical protein
MSTPEDLITQALEDIKLAKAIARPKIFRIDPTPAPAGNSFEIIIRKAVDIPDSVLADGMEYLQPFVNVFPAVSFSNADQIALALALALNPPE